MTWKVKLQAPKQVDSPSQEFLLSDPFSASARVAVLSRGLELPMPVFSVAWTDAPASVDASADVESVHICALASGGGGPVKSGIPNGVEVVRIEKNGDGVAIWRRHAHLDTGEDIVYCAIQSPLCTDEIVAAIGSRLCVLEFESIDDEKDASVAVRAVRDVETTATSDDPYLDVRQLITADVVTVVNRNTGISSTDDSSVSGCSLLIAAGGTDRRPRLFRYAPFDVRPSIGLWQEGELHSDEVDRVSLSKPLANGRVLMASCCNDHWCRVWDSLKNRSLVSVGFYDSEIQLEKAQSRIKARQRRSRNVVRDCVWLSFDYNEVNGKRVPLSRWQQTARAFGIGSGNRTQSDTPSDELLLIAINGGPKMTDSSMIHSFIFDAENCSLSRYNCATLKVRSPIVAMKADGTALKSVICAHRNSQLSITDGINLTHVRTIDCAAHISFVQDFAVCQRANRILVLLASAQTKTLVLVDTLESTDSGQLYKRKLAQFEPPTFRFSFAACTFVATVVATILAVVLGYFTQLSEA